MKSRTSLLAGGFCMAALLAGLACIPGKPSRAANLNVDTLLGRLPLSFEENRGQTDRRVDYAVRGLDYGLTLSPTRVLLSTDAPSDCSGCDPADARFGIARAGLEWVGANPEAKPQGEQVQQARSHYFLGQKPSEWVRDVRNYERVRYQELYKGIDVLYYGKGTELEYDLVVQPGADPNQARLRFPEASAARIAPEGDLLLTVGGATLRQRRPVSYQERGGVREAVESRYELIPGTKAPEVRFRLGTYDPKRPLVIDPVLVFSTMFGGGGTDRGQDGALDPSGNLWVVGSTVSTGSLDANNFPTLNPRQGFGGIADAVVLKLTPTGSLLHSSFLGGSSGEEGLSISVDGAGNPAVVGTTSSVNFPTLNPTQAALAGAEHAEQDGFLTRLSSNGSQLLFSTYLGGAERDSLQVVECDAAGNCVVPGTTYSLGLGTQGAFQEEFNGRSLFRTTDGAANWTGLKNGLPSGTATHIAVAPSNSSILYAGFNEYGVYRSTDGGLNWSEANGTLPENRRQIEALAVSPANPDKVYIGVHAGGATDVIYFTTNGGTTWSSDSEGMGSTPPSAFAFNPDDDGEMLAAIPVSGPSGGIRVRPDAPVWGQGPITGKGVYVFAQHPTNPDILYAGVEDGIYRSTNGGGQFTRVRSAGGIIDLSLSRGTPDTVYGIDRHAARLYQTTNGGTDWTFRSLPDSPWAVQADPVNPDTVYFGSDQSVEFFATVATVYKSTNAGQNFSPVVNGFGAQFISDFDARVVNNASQVYVAATASQDALVARFEANGTRTLCSYLGSTDWDNGAAVSFSNNRLSVAGTTVCPDFPTLNAGQDERAGPMDAFFARFNVAGSALEVSSYLGGTNIDYAEALDTDAGGNFLVAGSTRSSDFPGVNSGFQAANAGLRDAFVARIAANGSTVTYASLLGGSGLDSATDAVFGPGGHLFLFGSTPSTNFPTRDAFQTALAGTFIPRDSFVARFNPAVTGNSSLIYSTYLGGVSADTSGGMAVDPNGEVFLVGTTQGAFPLVSAMQPCYQGPADTFIAGDLFISRVGAGPAGPIAPRSLQAAAPSGNIVNLTWVDITTTESGYRILRAEGPPTANSQYVELDTVAANAQSFQDNTTVPNATYSYVVVATNAIGDSATCPVQVTTPASTTPPPAAPTGLSASAISSTQINLSWTDASTGETAFQIQRKEGAGGTYATIHTTGANASSYQDTGVTAGKQYFYQVRAQGPGGFSAFSNEANATTPQTADTTPPTITNVMVTPSLLPSSGGSVQISATITDAGGITSAFAFIAGANSTKVTLSLVSGNTYSGTYNAPPNPGSSIQNYTVTVTATDNALNQGSQGGGAFSVAAPSVDNVAPQISNITVQPRTRSSAGGSIQIGADVVDPALPPPGPTPTGTKTRRIGVQAVSSVIAIIQPPTGQSVNVTLTKGTGNRYTGTYSAPANPTADDRMYTVTIRATDDSGNQDEESAGTFTVEAAPQDETPPQISNIQVTPRQVGSSGGSVQVRVDVVDSGVQQNARARIGTQAVSSVVLVVEGAASSQIPLQLQSGNRYQGTFVAPPNTGSEPQVYTLTIQATDEAGNTSSQSAGTVTVLALGVPGGGEIQVSPAPLNFGDVKKGKTAIRKLVVHNTGGGTISVTLEGADAPFRARVLGGGSGATSVQGAGSGFTLGPGEKRSVEVRFKPGGIKTYQGKVRFSTDNPEQSVVTVRCTGRGCRANPTE